MPRATPSVQLAADIPKDGWLKAGAVPVFKEENELAGVDEDQASAERPTSYAGIAAWLKAAPAGDAPLKTLLCAHSDRLKGCESKMHICLIDTMQVLYGLGRYYHSAMKVHAH